MPQAANAAIVPAALIKQKIYFIQSTRCRTLIGRSGTPDCKRFSKAFGACWKRRFRRRKRSDFTAKSSRQQCLANLAEVNVNDRKQVIYKHPAATEKVEKASQLSYTVGVVDSQKIPTNRHVHQGIQTQKVCSAPGSIEAWKPGETNLRNIAAGE
jgi:hypothetical protein